MYVITYDISNNRRRTKLYNKLSGCGNPVQLSVFEVGEDAMDEALSIINAEIRAKDNVRVYQVCKRCMKSVKVFGLKSPALPSPSGATAIIEVPHLRQGKGKKEPTKRIGPLENGEITASSQFMELICAMENLNEAFLDVRSNRGCAGSDRQSLAAFDQRRAFFLAKLQKELLTNTYRPAPLKVFRIPKTDGSSRVLRVPAVRDRVVQQAVLRIIGPLWESEFEDASFAYRKGRSVRQAVARVCRLRDEGRLWVVRADIDDYFDEIPHEQIIERFSEKVADEQVVSLIAFWIGANWGIAAKGTDEKDRPSRFARKVPLRGIAQGSVISPLLSNIYLDRFDEAICRRGYRLIRYADDFVVVCRDEQEARDALDAIEEELVHDGLRLNAEKTTITTFAKGFKFLGYHFIRDFTIKTAKVPAGIRLTGGR
jgi:group II intron reverse transcriptase/maturase/CRISPR-associated endonuclease Cas2